MSQISLLLHEFRGDRIGWMCTDGEGYLLTGGTWAVRLPRWHPFLAHVRRGVLPRLPEERDLDCVPVGGSGEELLKSLPAEKIRSSFGVIHLANASGLTRTSIYYADNGFRLLVAEDGTPVWVQNRYLKLAGCADIAALSEVHTLRYYAPLHMVLWASATQIDAIVMPLMLSDPLALAVGRAAAAVINTAHVPDAAVTSCE